MNIDYKVGEVKLSYKPKFKNQPKVTCSEDAYRYILSTYKKGTICYKEYFKGIKPPFSVHELKTKPLAVKTKLLFLQPKALFLQTEILFIDFVCKIRFLCHRKMTFIRGQEETRKQIGKR